MTTGRRLREERERRGLSLEDVSLETRVPERYLKAIEDDEIERLPEGPYRKGYSRLYAGFLGLADHAAPETVTQTGASPSRAGVVAGAIIGALVVLGVAAAMSSNPPIPAKTADQEVRVEMLRSGHLTVIVDGVVEHDRYLEGGTVVEVTGHDRVVVEVPSVDRTRVTWNGKRIVPQGVQDQPRRLAFVDDNQGG